MNEEHAEIQTLKIIHLALTEDEEEVLMEGIVDYAKKVRDMPDSPERYSKGKAGYSLLEKLGKLLYGIEAQG